MATHHKNIVKQLKGLFRFLGNQSPKILKYSYSLLITLAIDNNDHVLRLLKSTCMPVSMIHVGTAEIWRGKIVLPVWYL